MGIVVRDMLRSPEKFNGIEMPLCAEMLPPRDLVNIFAETTGTKARLETKSLEEMRASKMLPGRLCLCVEEMEMAKRLFVC
jgi:hypothetical protein